MSEKKNLSPNFYANWALWSATTIFFMATVALFVKPKRVRETCPLPGRAQDIKVVLFDRQGKRCNMGAHSAFQILSQPSFFNVEKPWVHTLFHKKDLFISADMGIINQKKRHAHLRYNIKIIWGNDDYTIKTRKAFLSEGERKISTDSLIQGDGIFGRFTSKGAEISEKIITLRGPVSAVLKMENLGKI